MLKNRKILCGIVTCILSISTIYVLYSIILNPFAPFGLNKTFLAVATTIGFILLGTDKNINNTGY